MVVGVLVYYGVDVGVYFVDVEVGFFYGIFGLVVDIKIGCRD